MSVNIELDSSDQPRYTPKDNTIHIPDPDSQHIDKNIYHEYCHAYQEEMDRPSNHSEREFEASVLGDLFDYAEHDHIPSMANENDKYMDFIDNCFDNNGDFDRNYFENYVNDFYDDFNNYHQEHDEFDSGYVGDNNHYDGDWDRYDDLLDELHKDSDNEITVQP